MREQEFRSRDKKVHKMGRDGLIEQNQTTGEEQRISQRLADVSFEKGRPQEQAAGHRAAKRVGRPNPQGQQTPAQTLREADPMEGLEAPEVWGPSGAPASMRDAGDKPVVKKRPQTKAEPEEPIPRKPPPRDSRRNQEKPEKQSASRRTGESGRLKFAAGEKPQEERGKPAQKRPRFEDAVPPPVEDTAPDVQNAGADTPDNPGDAAQDRPHRQYEKAKRRVEQSGRKLEKAQGKLPTRRKIQLSRQYDSGTGRVRRRLQFEQEAIPEHEKPGLPKRAAKGAVQTAKTAAIFKAHMKIREVEQQNVAVEAAHKGEFLAERSAGRFLRWNRQRLHTKPYRDVRKAERRLAKDNARLAWHTALRDNPELQKKSALMKWVQKQKIKRKYAQAAREAQKTAQHTRNVLTATGQVVRAAAQMVAAHKAVFLAVAGLVVVVLFFSAGLASCTAMLSGIQSSYIASCYVADEAEIDDSELHYTELETDLQKDIDDTEINYPGYDEYRYNIGEIGHNPYELMGYLSAAYDAFTYEQVQAELNRLFGEQYTLTREEIVETRHDSEGDPYDWYVLQTTLSVRPLGQIIAESLPPGEQSDRYGVYMQTYGNRQAFGNPFDFAWLSYVSSPYGYRIHPISGEKDLHRGMDIAVAQGTPIMAIQDGQVISAGDAGDYGLCVVIEDDKGYQSRYAHCASLSVSAGQEVKRGDVIATVGSIGNSTGPHLHLETMLNGQYLNPYYFVNNGDTSGGARPGEPGGPVIPDYSGEPMGNGSFAAMLAEAEKYLGYPYVWGGSSPSTSFDCSGYVSWVINQSGVGSVGRQTAGGLYNLSTPVSRENAQPGDLIFFTGTYSSPGPVSHVGIYVGNGQMIHCGDPISYANINSSYWTKHFYAFGRIGG